MTSDTMGLVERLEGDIRAHEITGNGGMRRVQNVRDAISAIRGLERDLVTQKQLTANANDRARIAHEKAEAWFKAAQRRVPAREAGGGDA